MKTQALNRERPIRDIAERAGFDPSQGKLYACKLGFVIVFANEVTRMVFSAPGHLGKVTFLDPDERPGYEEEEIERLGGLEA